MQAGTTDSGDLAIKPLVNLHLTPNGCGLLGCDKNADLLPKQIGGAIMEAITNPFGIHDPAPAFYPGLAADYTAPGLSSSYGVPDTSYSAPSTGYGAPSSGYGAPSSGYGAPKPSYGAPLSTYTPPKPSYKTPQTASKPSYNAPQPSYTAAQPTYNAPAAVKKPSYHPPSYKPPSFNEKDSNSFAFDPATSIQQHQHQTGEHGPQHGAASVGNVNIHHHYHHTGLQQGGLGQLFREDTDTNQVKRNTDPAGFIPSSHPNFGGESSSSSLGFRFPRQQSHRGGRKLTFQEEVEETDKTEEDNEEEKESESEVGELTDAEVEEITAAEETLKKTGGFRFADRKRRSPDGVGHHHGVHTVVGVPANGGGPFGPGGYRPPSCGGPGSGYVCCSASPVATSSLVNSVGFGEVGLGGDSVRDIRQEPEQFGQALTSSTSFSQFGQCGRRNAHGVTGRINNPAQKWDEGDTEFGEYPWQVALLKKEQYDNVYVCGASLIDASHLLTAAHCIKQYRPEELRVRLGEWDVNNDSEFYPNIELDVLSIKVHPEFYSGNLYNDLAIIKLDGFVDFQRNPHISPVCLPDNFQASIVICLLRLALINFLV